MDGAAFALDERLVGEDGTSTDAANEEGCGIVLRNQHNGLHAAEI
jgi:hypothetical protein